MTNHWNMCLSLKHFKFQHSKINQFEWLCHGRKQKCHPIVKIQKQYEIKENNGMLEKSFINQVSWIH